MARLPALLRTLLPPVVVATAVAAVFARALSPETLRAAREDSIRARWSVPAEFDRLPADVEAYLADHADDPDARRLAAEAYARMLLPQRAFEITFPAGRAPDARETRRFAQVMLEVLGTVPGPPPHPSALWSRTVLARVDGNDAAAREELETTVAGIDMNGIVAWFIPAFRSETGGKRALVAALSKRDDPAFQLAAAIGSTGPKVLDRLPFLIATYRSPEWHEARRPTWQQMCRALGAAGTPEAVAALRADRATRTDPGPDGEMRRLSCDVGLALAGDAEARARVLAASADRETSWVPLLYVGGLETRLFQGDVAAAPELARMWPLLAPAPGTPPHEETVARLQLAVGLMLSDALPPPTIPVEDWAQELRAHASPLQRALALAWDWRRRDAATRDERLARMVEALGRGIAESPLFVAGSYDTAGVGAVVELLRAWYRWS